MKFHRCSLENLGTAQDREERRTYSSYLMVRLCFHIGQRNGHSTTLYTKDLYCDSPIFHLSKILMEVFMMVWV